MDKKTKHSPSLVSAAAKAIAGGKEALDDFVLEASSDLLEQFDSAMSAAQSVAGEKKKAGGKSKQSMRQINPRSLHAEAREAYGRGEYGQAADLWSRAEPLVESDQDRNRILHNLRLAQQKQEDETIGKKVRKDMREEPQEIAFQRLRREADQQRRLRDIRDLQEK
tara:strand:- start:119 stop:616 length:498 start_codon:yes stop_codon:yes gene_type:complete